MPKGKNLFEWHGTLIIKLKKENLDTRFSNHLTQVKGQTYNYQNCHSNPGREMYKDTCTEILFLILEPAKTYEFLSKYPTQKYSCYREQIFTELGHGPFFNNLTVVVVVVVVV